MTTLTLRRLAWQIPLLLTLPSVLLPFWGWHTAWFGPWPLWLAAMPLAAYGLSRRALAGRRPDRRPARAQVLVFPAVAPRPRPIRGPQRRAA